MIFISNVFTFSTNSILVEGHFFICYQNTFWRKLIESSSLLQTIVYRYISNGIFFDFFIFDWKRNKITWKIFDLKNSLEKSFKWIYISFSVKNRKIEENTIWDIPINYSLQNTRTLYRLSSKSILVANEKMTLY